MTLPKAVVRLAPAFPPEVILDGYGPLTGIQAVHAYTDGSGLPKLALELAADVRVEHEGVVEVDRGGSDDVLAFLRNIDPAILSERAAELGDWGTGPGEAFLKALRIMAGEEESDAG